MLDEEDGEVSQVDDVDACFASEPYDLFALEAEVGLAEELQVGSVGLFTVEGDDLFEGSVEY